MNHLRRVLICSGYLFLLGCASHGSVNLNKAGSYKPDDYDKIRDRWTRYGEVLRALDTSLYVHATLEAPDFSSAFISRYTHMFGLPNVEKKELKQEKQKKWQAGYVFKIAAATHSMRDNDFDRTDSVWHLYLSTTKKKKVAPLTIKRQRRLTQTTREFYPFLGAFHRFYEVTFPKNLPDGSPLIDKSSRVLNLHLAGPQGRTKLTWRLQ